MRERVPAGTDGGSVSWTMTTLSGFAVLWPVLCVPLCDEPWLDEEAWPDDAESVDDTTCDEPEEPVEPSVEG